MLEPIIRWKRIFKIQNKQLNLRNRYLLKLMTYPLRPKGTLLLFLHLSISYFNFNERKIS